MSLPPLRLPFKGQEAVKESWSGISQDLFVLMALDGKRDGTYLEIGANDPRGSNNTYVLERDFGWRGVSVEIDTDLVQRFNTTRHNPCLAADARHLDYNGIGGVMADGETFKLSGVVDYLSLDIDPPENTYDALLKVLETDMRFRVITFEHDLYCGGRAPQIRAWSRGVLYGRGYHLAVPDVAFNGQPAEDWWLDLGQVDPERIAALTYRPMTDDRMGSVWPRPINHDDYIRGTANVETG